MKAGAGMAKDGTARGGARYGAGRKPKPLADRVMAGESAKAIELPEPPVFEGADVPPVQEKTSAQRKFMKRLGVGLRTEDARGL